MRIVKHDLDLRDRFKVVVDHDAEPSDLDAALAKFLVDFYLDEQSGSGSGSVDLTPEQKGKP